MIQYAPTHATACRSVTRVSRPAVRLVLILALTLSLAGLSACATVKRDAGSDASLAVQEVSRADMESAPEHGEEPEQPTEDAVAEFAEKDSATPLSPQEEQALATQADITFELDSVETKEMLSFFRYFTHDEKGRKHFTRWLERSEAYLPYVRQVFAERGLPHDLVYLPFVESGYNPRAGSHAGAKGLWQFMPFTGKKYGLNVGWWLDERYDPYKSTIAAADYLSKLHDDFDDWYLALAAYNAGEGRVMRAVKSSGCDDFFKLSQMQQDRWRRGKRLYYLPKETRNYVPKLMAVIKIVRNLEALGFTQPNWDAPANIAAVQTRPRTDLRAMSKAIGMPWDDFRTMNPAYVESGTHPERKSTIYVPTDRADAARAYLASSGFREYSGYYTFYKVRKGDSWYRISNRFGVPIAVLKSYNDRTGNLLRPGQSIKVPGKGTSGMLAEKLRESDSKSAAPARVATRSKGSYTVRKGDSLWSVARDHGVSMGSLARVNNLSTRARIHTGQKLALPDTGTSTDRTRQLAQSRSNYSVKSGDTLWGVAKRFNTTVGTLARANGISRDETLRPGQNLYIPDQGANAARLARNEAKKATQTITYRVCSGDTLYDIAKRFGVTTRNIMAWNNLSSPDIRPGDSLKLYQ
ncbi:membrane-bound lytic murein transglycosylase D [Desulfobaculum xiamenense]|uniref:Membrane-bound lytic murein transglycosylase D n=1 Tax=Desulfobaculum xiamenense TaxID=995050 RepID=A0A846QP33_9BACT|nr:LysM peptidoglycan-binding domain-containing protein [Desulfobaculum xiamenense]NJB68053.1 membrane-bound lytic murein transglycosylase D [Desulfobaculum xiamenense]